ncbi:MAG: tetratricopeptide repeat protein, partial [Pseudomonadota bacterium]|nr:tetratricopeptide repeat protein [Pseudomonadota bacterium]
DILRRILAGLCAVGILAALGGCEEAAPPQSALDKARQALARGDGIAAEEQLRASLRDAGATEDVAAYLGEAALLQDDLVTARHWLQPGRFSAATALHGYRMLGRLEMREGNLSVAGAAFDQALSIDADRADLWIDIGHLRYRGGEQVQAIAAADRALAIDPDSAVALQFRAQLVRDAYGPLAALPWLERALEVAPDDLALQTDYAANLGEVGRASEALSVLREVAERAPKAPRLLYLQAVIAARGGNLPLARDLYLRSPAQDRETPAGQMFGGVLDLELGHHASAAQTFARLAAAQPDNRQVARLFTKALSLSGGERELIARFASRGGRSSPYTGMLVARALETLDRRAEAATYLDTAARPGRLAIAPLASDRPVEAARYADLSSGLALRDYLRAMIATGGLADGASQARLFARRFPGSSDAQNLLGDALLANDEAEAAIAAYREAALVRTDWPLMKRLVAAYQRVGAQAAARASLRAYLEGGAREPMAAALYGEWLARDGEFGQAAAMIDSALAHGAGRDPSV